MNELINLYIKKWEKNALFKFQSILKRLKKHSSYFNNQNKTKQTRKLHLHVRPGVNNKHFFVVLT